MRAKTKVSRQQLAPLAPLTLVILLTLSSAPARAIPAPVNQSDPCFGSLVAEDQRGLVLQRFQAGDISFGELLTHPLFSRVEPTTGKIEFLPVAWGEIPIASLRINESIDTELIRQIAVHHGINFESFRRFLRFGRLLGPSPSNELNIRNAIQYFSSPPTTATEVVILDPANANLRRVLSAALTREQLGRLFGNSLAEQITRESADREPHGDSVAFAQEIFREILARSSRRHPTETAAELIIALSHLSGPRTPPVGARTAFLGAIRTADEAQRWTHLLHLADLKSPENRFFDAATDLQRRLFIEAAEPRLGNEPRWLPPPERRLFFHVELSILKLLNDLALRHDKALVDGAIGLYHRLFLETLRNDPRFSLLARLLVQAGGEPVQYADFKSLRFLFDVPPADRAQVILLLNALQADVGRRFEFHILRLLPPEARERLAAAGEHANQPRNWYLSGLGGSVAHAALAARLARADIRPASNGANVPPKDMAEMWERTARLFREVESSRSEVEREFLALGARFQGEEGLLVVANPEAATPVHVLSSAAVEALRTAKDKSGVAFSDPRLAAYIQREFEQRFGVNLTQSQATLAGRYYQQVDALSASPLFESRQIPSLDNAPHGIISGDIIGMGVINMQHTMTALALQRPVEGATDNQVVDRGIGGSVQGAQLATNDANAIRRRFNGAAAGLGQVQFSGDDMLMRPAQQFSTSAFETFLRQLLQQPGISPSHYRIVGVPPIVPVPRRSGVVVGGEKLEKTVRKSLLGMIDGNGATITPSRLRQLLIAVEVTELSDGPAGPEPTYRLIVGGPESTLAMRDAIIRALGTVTVERARIDAAGTRILGRSARLRLLPVPAIQLTTIGRRTTDFAAYTNSREPRFG